MHGRHQNKNKDSSIKKLLSTIHSNTRYHPLHSDQENYNALSRGLGDSEIPKNEIINSIKILRKKAPSTGQTQANTQKPIQIYIKPDVSHA